MSSALPTSTSASASAESKAPISVGDENTEGKKKIEAKIEAIEAEVQDLKAQLKKAEKKRDDWEEKNINSKEFDVAEKEVLSLRARIHDEETQLHDLREEKKLLLQPHASSSTPSQGKSSSPYVLCAGVCCWCFCPRSLFS